MSMMLISLILTTALYLTTMISMNPIMNKNKMSPFECGFSPILNIRNPFSIQFFKILIIFLLFDMEIMLILPMFLFNVNSISSTSMTMIIIIVIIAGLIIEWKEGSLEWLK